MTRVPSVRIETTTYAPDAAALDRMRRIEDSFRKLPIKRAPPDRPHVGLPLELAIPGMGRDLLIVAGAKGRKRRRNEMHASAAKAKQELVSLQKKADAVHAALEASSYTTLNAIGYTAEAIWRVKSSMSVLAKAAELAELPEKLPKATTGKAPDDYSLRLARRALFFYEFLTGRQATRSWDEEHGEIGVFTGLISDLFAAVGNDEASAEHFARAAIASGPIT